MTATADIQRSNGDATAEPTFPLDSFREAATHLRRPFTPAAVKFKVQAVWPKDAPTGGLIVAYIDARLAVERLNLIVPHLWHDEYQQIDGRLLLCRLTVDGITRQDVGEGQGKGLFSDALKRAAVKFGIGVSLYATPKMIVNAGEHAKQKRSRDGMSLELTPAGDQHIRRLYETWLNSHGVKAFGKPLDHGDVEGAQGDTEADEPPAPAPEAAPPLPQLDDAAVAIVAQAVKEAKPTVEVLRTQLVALGVHSVPEGKITLDTLRGLSEDQAKALVDWCHAQTEAATV